MALTPDQELQNNREVRQFWERIIILLLAALPSLFNLYIGYSSGTRLQNADVDRSRIEEKIDDQKVITKVAVEKAEVAAEHAKTAAQEVKTTAEETKNVIMEIKDITKSLPLPQPPPE